MDILMKCGHTAQGTCSSIGGKDVEPFPVCVICGCAEQVEKPDLKGRKAKCSYKHKGDNFLVDSSYNLAFFEYRPDEPYDIYYCGCFGWD